MYMYLRKPIPLLFAILLVAIFLRFHSLSIYKFYPDSYQPLLVAHNIETYGSVIGPLGNTGMLYPDFFGWTRPTYPLLITLFNFFVANSEAVARALSFIFGILAIPLAYLFVSSALGSKKGGLFGALLLALSFSHSIWGGFILSDTTGVFFLLLSLWLFFRNLHSQYELADWHDLLWGTVFAVAILTRYEYAILIIPFAFLMYKQSPRPFIRIINSLAGISITIACTYFFLSPFSIDTSATATQIGSFIGPLGHIDISGIQRFILSDIAITLFSCIGIYLLFRDRNKTQDTLIRYTL